MGGDEEMWVLFIFISVSLVLLFVPGIREYLTRRKLPKNPEDKEIRRAMRRDSNYFFLHPFGGGGEKHYDDNPIKHKVGDDGTLFK